MKSPTLYGTWYHFSYTADNLQEYLAQYVKYTYIDTGKNCDRPEQWSTPIQ